MLSGKPIDKPNPTPRAKNGDGYGHLDSLENTPIRVLRMVMLCDTITLRPFSKQELSRVVGIQGNSVSDERSSVMFWLFPCCKTE